MVQKNDYRKNRIVKFWVTHAYTKNLKVVSAGVFSEHFEIFISMQNLVLPPLFHYKFYLKNRLRLLVL